MPEPGTDGRPGLPAPDRLSGALDSGGCEAVVALKDGSVRAHGPPAEVVSADLLAAVFDIEASVTDGPHGPRITPLEPVHDADGTAGGTAEEEDAGRTPAGLADDAVGEYVDADCELPGRSR